MTLPWFCLLTVSRVDIKISRVFAPALRLRAKTDLSGDDQWSELAFGKIVVGRDSAILRPMIEAVRVFSKDVLDVLYACVLGLTLHDLLDFRFQLVGLLIERLVGNGQGA